MFVDPARYKPRIIDAQVQRALRTYGAVAIEGAKWCGKTWTSAVQCHSAVYLGDPAGGFQHRRQALHDPSLVLSGETPRLIDEWHEASEIWDAVRFEVDHRSQRGQFVLTGSSTPKRKEILHSGAGRIGRLRMRPMTLVESGDSSGAISLQDICAGNFTNQAVEATSVAKLVELIVRGGWPGALGMPLADAKELPRA